MFRKIGLLLAASLSFLSLGFADDLCGDCSDWISIGGQTVVVGTFATPAAAAAAAADTAAHNDALLSAVSAYGQGGCFEEVCTGGGTGCAPYWQFADVEFQVSTTQGPNGFLVYVTVTGPDPRYRLCCEPDCPE